MRTNIDIDEKLLAKAQKLGNIKTKKLAVEKALELFVRLESQKRLLDLWGKVEIDDEVYQ
ncbi:type II toxin-antitoxin system VapB family antitoxin [Mucilaginibacter terrae]|uniref:Arc/MetJ family transcription regulator n=1 Tax=Mucilaginibacter terrae TaxID=1955052 RepID=A0ABU3GVS1_9SPHI|nr:type II toxin-antitoxin system VapB family antitoxin [Mucilaginibacter terrae]MDT3402725.1 Arc/MetJ family transcription regulator [Mucilaginibacter terrae]